MREAFRQGLADAGYVEGRDIAIEWRSAEGSRPQMPALAAELVALQVAVIVVTAIVDVQFIQAVTSTIPIVVVGTGTGDLVDYGLAASYAHPGGQVTGLSIPAQLEGKRLQLLQEAAPGLSKVAVLRDANIHPVLMPDELYEGFAQRLSVQLQILPVTRSDELDGAFAAMSGGGADGLYVPNSSFADAQRAKIVALAAEHRLPAMYPRQTWLKDGGLMSYEPSFPELYRRAASYVDRILKGAPAGTLPVEQPMTFDFVINQKTAKALGLTIPYHILLQATEVIE